MLYLSIVLAVVILAYLYFRGDQDGDGDVDLDDLKISGKELNEDILNKVEEVISSIKEGKVTKSKLNSMTKQQLVDSAKADHGVDLDMSLKKSSLVNKVYGLYNS